MKRIYINTMYRKVLSAILSSQPLVVDTCISNYRSISNEGNIYFMELLNLKFRFVKIANTNSFYSLPLGLVMDHSVNFIPTRISKVKQHWPWLALRWVMPLDWPTNEQGVWRHMFLFNLCNSQLLNFVQKVVGLRKWGSYFLRGGLDLWRHVSRSLECSDHW